MRTLTALLVAFLLLGSSNAFAEERGSAGFCLAVDDQTKTYYFSDTFKTDPSTTQEQYITGFQQALHAQGKQLPVECKFTDLADRIPVYLNGLKQQCSDCAVYSVQRVAWTPGKQDAANQKGAAGGTYKARDNVLAG